MGTVIAILFILFVFSLFVHIVNSMFRNISKINDQRKRRQGKGDGSLLDNPKWDR